MTPPLRPLARMLTLDRAPDYNPACLQISGLAGFQANITRAKAATRLGSTGFANLPPRLTAVPTITPSAVRR